MPASETSATDRPSASAAKQPRPLRRAVVVVVGQDRARVAANAVDLQQLARLAGVLGGEDVGARQHVERAEGDVARVADRGRHEVEAGRQRLGRRIGEILCPLFVYISRPKP